MGKLRSERERRLQRKLIPLNIVICLISIAAAVSLFLFPFVKVDIGKILRNGDTVAFVENKVENMVGESLENAEAGTVDFAPVVSAIVANVLSTAKGEVSVSAFNASKVAFYKGENKTEQVLNQLLYADDGLVNNLINSVADGVVALFDTDGEGGGIVEEMIVSTIAVSLAADLPEEAAAKVNKDTLPALTDKFREMNGVENREQAEVVANGFTDSLGAVFGDVYDIEQSRGEIVNFVLELYDDTLKEIADKEGETFSVEAMVSVAVSKNVDLNKFNLSEILSGLIKKSNNEETASLASYSVAEGEEDGTGIGTEGEQGGETGGTEEGGESGGENESGDKLICTNYGEILTAMGLGADDIDELKETLRADIRMAVDNAVEPYTKYINYYGYIFYGMLAFIVPWLILFLFSFFHMLAKNKRFMMWYVKLYSFLPCLVFFIAPKVAPWILDKFAPNVLSGDKGPLIKAALTGVSSYTYISGICYLLLWLFSICWAFPIKHKIRKERKACKRAARGGGVPQPQTYGAPADGTYGNAYGGSEYGDSYGNGGYGGYDNNYGYGSPYGGYDDYSSYDGGFDEPYTGGYGVFDDYAGYGSYDSYGSDYDDYGSGYGSSYGYDDDDDY